jgi:hypothetical protein
MTTLATLATDQLERFNTFLRARPFTEKERAYWELCWLEITQPQLDSINAALPPHTVATARAYDGKLYINSDIISDAIDDGRLSAIYVIVSSLTWRYINPWEWEQAEVQDWQAYDGTPATIFQIGTVKRHNDKTWVSAVPNNVWEPSVFGWQEVTAQGISPKWRQPLGAGDAWDLNDEVLHANRHYRSLIANNVWEPGAVGSESLWLDITVTEPPDDAPAAWKPWTSGLNADLYQIGDRVTHKGAVWRATTGNNHWEPGVFGWVQE